MKKVIKLFSSIMVGAVALVLVVSAPGAGSAEAYVSYNNTTSSSPNYKVYNTTNYQSYNYNYTKPTTNSQTTYNKPSYNQPNYNKPTYNQPTYNQPSSNTGSSSQSSSGVVTSEEQAMLNLINKERAAKGLKALSMDAALTQIARTKAKDMVDNNYFSHTSPTYGSPFDMMKNNGVVYHYAGENLAGAPDVNTAHTNLMNSPNHRANILKPEYTKVGIGVASGSKYGKIYVQEFNG